ncbi:[weak similarity to] 4-diphosphocytidyl-2-methyl-D-erithritol synthase, partial [methanotrophic bacterial endosymbiont of Bathymodiolus sp.]
GYKDGALAWLKDAVQEKKYQNNLAKKIRVFSLVDFLTWANETF